MQIGGKENIYVVLHGLKPVTLPSSFSVVTNCRTPDSSSILYILFLWRKSDWRRDWSVLYNRNRFFFFQSIKNKRKISFFTLKFHDFILNAVWILFSARTVLLKTVITKQVLVIANDTSRLNWQFFLAICLRLYEILRFFKETWKYKTFIMLYSPWETKAGKLKLIFFI